MEQYIEEKLAPVVERFHGKKWDRAIATSGTAAAVVCTINRVGRTKIDQADQLRASTAQVRRLYEELCREDLAGRRRHTGIGPKRAEIIIPGAACLLRIMQDFDLPSVYYSSAGLRDGIIADLAARGVGMEPSGLDREQQRVVEAMARRYGVSLAHARQVAGLAASLFRSLEPLHGLPPVFGRLLEAAAYLHDIGHFVSDTRHHRHSYYLVANSDMPGFTDRERTLVANLCRYHRKAMPTVEHDNLDPLNAQERRAVMLLTPLLRLADNLDRSHEQRIGSVECFIRNGQVQIKLGAKSDIDLEQWAAERATDAFRQVYGKPLVMTKAKM
jgi:exopolyphosphatase/guanosine-5'-triphosphate,3'-diphosphate pyrophosphatase